MSLVSILLGALLGALAYWLTTLLTADRRIAAVVGIIVFILIAFSLIPLSI